MNSSETPAPREGTPPLPGHPPDALASALFLAEASRLLAGSLDYETTLETVARLALPHLGAWCIVDVVEPDGSVRRLSIIHPDPRKQELASRLQYGWPPERDDPLGAPAVIRTRRAEVIPEVSDDQLVRVARDEENLHLLQQLGIGTLMVVPLIARGQVLGAITFVSPRGDRYTQQDLALAEDLAARGALALDNARLYRMAEEARVAAEAARASAQAAERAKTQFLAVTSHELRTPLNAILGYTQLLDLGLDGPVTEGQREKLGRIDASVRHLVGLVNEILDLATVEAGRMTVHSEVGDVSAVAEAAYNLVQPQLAERSHVLENRCAGPSAVSYVGDPDRVRQILVNLLINACKFTPPGGRVVVTCGVAESPDPGAVVSGVGPWTHVDVEDTGPGIPPDRLEAIFEAFVQGETETFTRTKGGSGLGLAVSRRLARLMGGDLTVDSTLGKGSRFTLWLPAPRVAPVSDQPRAEFGTPGLARVGSLVLERLGAILAGYTARLRADPDLPAGLEVGDAALQDHALTFLSGIAQQMLALDAGGAPGLTRDTGKIHRTVAELHGTQRRRLGWSEEQLCRDLGTLREEVLSQVREAALPDEELEEAIDVLERLLGQGERISLGAWKRAEAPGEGGG